MNSAASNNSPEFSAPLDTRSLELLRDALAGGKLLRRNADKIEFSVEMTEADVSGFIAFVGANRDAYTGALRQIAATRPEMASISEALLKMMQGVAVSPIDKTHVHGSIDLTKLSSGFFSPLDPLQDRDESTLTNLADVTGQGLDVDRDLTVQKVVRDFAAGRLKAYPPEKSLEPGTGMGEIKPATRP
jgi:hypothetical protein